MDDKQTIEKRLETVFDKYKFTKDQRDEALNDLLKMGESLTFTEISKLLSEEQKVIFNQYLAGDSEKKKKFTEIYSFLNEIIGEDKVNEIHAQVYQKLIDNYTNHMNS